MTIEANAWNRNNSSWREMVDSATITIDVTEQEKVKFNAGSSLVTLTGAQTLTNKTLTSPAINSGTLNAALMVETLPAGETLADGDLCYLNSDGEMYLADADAEATADTLLAICTQALTDGNSGTFIIRGRYTTSGLTAGAVYYVSLTAGDWTATAPSATGDIVRIVGYALSSTVLLFMPDNTYVEIA